MWLQEPESTHSEVATGWGQFTHGLHVQSLRQIKCKDLRQIICKTTGGWWLIWGGPPEGGYTDEEAATRLEHLLAGEKACAELMHFVAENAADEMLAPILAPIKELAVDLMAMSTFNEPATEASKPRNSKLTELFLRLKQMRAQVHPKDPDIRLDLARAIHEAWREAKDRNEVDRCRLLLGDLRLLASSFADDPAVRFEFAKVLMASADDPSCSAELLTELRDLHNANPTDSGLRALAAWALHVESNNAGVAENQAIHELKLNELRQLSMEYPQDAAVRFPLAKSLGISSKRTIENGDTDTRDALLNELRALVSAYPDDGAVRLFLVEALFAAGVKGRLNGAPEDDFFHEVYSIVCAHPNDDALSEFFNSRYKKASDVPL